MRKRLGSIAAWGLAALLAAVPAAEAQQDHRPGEPLQFSIAERGIRVVPHGTPLVVWVTNHSDKVVVAYGVQVLQRDRHARLRPLRRVVVRPRDPMRPGFGGSAPIRVDGLAPEYEVLATFVLYEDGTWAGDAEQARAEVAAMREEYVAARDMGQALAAVPERPDRAALVRLADRFSQGLARAAAPRARQQYEAGLDTIARVLDERLRGDRTYEEAIVIARIRVDRALGQVERYPFVATAAFRG
ncbi:hypothetical protein TBR22_A22110 [Luteitalea sp. TBR-22]|uniref:hypothetical protein n=1 Tax=Luteitalea sp. TBR-22 TaxID=2802971 RepID=UPI001AF70049|nr:hypothetical protein [Luteitalea sp. TBR-22]BCS32986.1 hypothetical protein TBR22_A22110 [Luteitalea sp. TBR-22]